MVAVIKAISVSITFNYAQRDQRLLSITRQGTASSVAVVDEQRTHRLALKVCRTLPMIQPSEMLYLVFASGSTGEPKSDFNTHANITSAHLHREDAMDSAASYIYSILNPHVRY